MEFQVLQSGLRAQLREAKAERVGCVQCCSTALEHPRQHNSIGDDPGGKRRGWKEGGSKTTGQWFFEMLFVFLELFS